MPELQAETGLLVGETELLRRRPDTRNLICRDARANELDGIVKQAQESERSVREMESLMRSSGVEFGSLLSDRVGIPGVPVPPPAAQSDRGSANRVRNR